MTSEVMQFFDELAAAPPLLQAGQRLDPFIEVTVEAGVLLGRTEGGREFDGEVTRLGNSHRLRWRPRPVSDWQPSPQLLARGEPVELHAVPGGVKVGDNGPLIGPSGPRHPPLVAAPPLATFGGFAPTSGPLVNDSAQVSGWVHSFALGPHDAVYGGGENPGALNLRGQRRVGANSESIGAGQIAAGYLNVPWFWSDAGWSVLAVHGGAVAIDAGSTLTSTFTIATEGPHADLVFSTGSPTELMTEHTAVTGRAAGLPDWAFGVWFGRCSYLTEEQLHAIIDDLNSADCPVDVLHVDCWSRSNLLEGFTTDWEVDRRRFPLGWGDRLRERGVRLSLWHNPFVTKGAALGEWSGAVVAGAGGEPVSVNSQAGRRLIDFTNPGVRDRWQRNVRALLATEGASALKTDFGEEVPDDATFADGRSGKALRNAYSLLYQQASYEAAESVMFTRSGTAGAQRYPGHWVGDQPSTWQGFEAAVRSTLALSASGFAAVGADVGGFWNSETFDNWMNFPLATAPDLLALAEDRDAFVADVPPELFTRWAQWGALTGLMRFHGAGVREPTAYPEPYRGHTIAAARLRKRLEGYLLDTAREATRTGVPMCRVMPLAFPEALDGRAADTQHCLGPDILVAPALEPGGGWRCWVPPGEWTRWNGSPVAPGWLVTSLALGDMPALLRKGSPVSRLIDAPA